MLFMLLFPFTIVPSISFSLTAVFTFFVEQNYFAALKVERKILKLFLYSS
jgi:hypothetical protein